MFEIFLMCRIIKHLQSRYYRAGAPKEAADYLGKYLAAAPCDLSAWFSLEAAKNMAVKRWHYRMLNDDLRNAAFREAIIKSVRKGYDTVLDIGTGTGIFSLFAVEAKARSVTACESSSAMAAIASDVLSQLSTGEVVLINMHSEDLTVPTDLPQRVSLVVSEILDCGLLGEHVLPTILDARTRLLAPGGVVIPYSATLHLCGIQSETVSSIWTLKNHPKGLGLEDINIYVECENYDTECLQTIPSGYKKLTDVESVFSVDFNNIDDIIAVVEGKKDCDFTLTFRHDGILDAFAAWFTLRLDEDITLSTSPDEQIRCWEQAIIPVKKGIRVKINQICRVRLSFKMNMKIEIVEEDGGKPGFVVGQPVVRLLNNTELVSALEATARKLASSSEEKLRVLDMSPFPLFGLRLLQFRQKTPNLDQLICVTASQDETELVRELAGNLNLARKVLCVNLETAEAFIQRQQQFDIVVVSPVEDDGVLCQKQLSMLPAIRKCLKPGGRILPHEVTVVGQMVESEWLREVSRVAENVDVTGGFRIAPFINRYVVDHQIDFRLSEIGASKIGHPFPLICIPLTTSDGFDCTQSIDLVRPANGVVYWHKVAFLPDCPESEFSTNSESSLFNQSAFLLHNTEEFVSIRTEYENGQMRVACV